jgi:hypothetical protein
MTDNSSVSPQDEIHQLQFLRAEAINAYASFEQSLCRVFSALLGTSPKLAAIVFYRITNTHSRNRIIDELLAKRYSNIYEAYWNGIPNMPHRSGLFTIIRQLDQSRNEIIHWHMTSKYHPQKPGPLEIGLMKPDVLPISFDVDARTITSGDLIDFCSKANFVAHSLHGFFFLIQGGNFPTPEMRATWQEIFAQPASYPPPDTNPLSRNWKAPETPPRSSGA